MRLRRRKTIDTSPPGHFGVRLRISNMNGELVDTDSDHLYWLAIYGLPNSCTPACLPGCDRHGWFELIPGDGFGGLDFANLPPSPLRLKIEVKPVMLHEPSDG